MKAIEIRGASPLQGTVEIQGAKNSVLKLLVATILAPSRHKLCHVPAITDVYDMVELIKSLGVTASISPENHSIIVDTPSDIGSEPPGELVEKMRASVVLLGPLLTKTGFARLPLPGGDDLGPRPIDIHIRCLEAMGAEIKLTDAEIVARTRGNRLVGTRLVLEYPSHTATDNLIMAASLATGTTIIENAAREPEVVDLATYLNSMGAKIKGAGTSRIEIDGVSELTPTKEHYVVPDRVEAATFLGAVGMLGGEIFLSGARAHHMDMLLVKLDEIGVKTTPTDEGILARSSGMPRSIDISTLPYPGVATDYKPMLVTLLSIAKGVSIVTENLFIGRFRYVEELVKMGADIRTEGHHVVVRGVPRLKGAKVKSHDIRAGAALVLAGLVGEGTTYVTDIFHIERGYENLVGKLSELGANIGIVDSGEI
ncbi:MAG: UDP-N-acetylglucosamine 1-carboxyvinyltransferase [Acidimicrobiales bacterium]|nr:UDP-N-acetylglucosamine 1-carboxyvinyltransferase [Acidimicrobiales bacterium]